MKRLRIVNTSGHPMFTKVFDQETGADLTNAFLVSKVIIDCSADRVLAVLVADADIDIVTDVMEAPEQKSDFLDRMVTKVSRLMKLQNGTYTHEQLIAYDPRDMDSIDRAIALLQAKKQEHEAL